MLAHHVGMVATAYLVVLLPSFYATFYLGWTELSSIVMQLWEMFCHAHDLAEVRDGGSQLRALGLGQGDASPEAR